MPKVNERVDALDPEIGKAIIKLEEICGYIIRYAAFIEATIEYGDQSKLVDSFSGHVVSWQIKGNAHLNIMAICRFWDRSHPLKIAQKIQNHSSDILKIRQQEHPDWRSTALELEEFDNELNKTVSLANSFLNSQDYGHIRTFRTEFLAHNQDGPSRDREKYIGANTAPETKLLQLIEASKLTYGFLDRLHSHWFFHTNDNDGAFKILKSYSNVYWDALPHFENVENADLLN